MDEMEDLDDLGGSDEVEEVGETLGESPDFEEVQEPEWPFTALGIGAGALGGMAVARSLQLLARVGVGAAIACGTYLVLQEFLVPMTTTVLADEIRVRYGRRTRFRIPLKNVVRAFVRTYDPLREYGGWGIRYGVGGRAFNMRGSEGVQLVLRSGQRVLIGSQRARELADAVQDLTGCSSQPD